MVSNETRAAIRTTWTDHRGVTTFLETVALKIRDNLGNERIELTQSVWTHDPKKSCSLSGKVTLLASLGAVSLLTTALANYFFFSQNRIFSR